MKADKHKKSEGKFWIYAGLVGKQLAKYWKVACVLLVPVLIVCGIVAFVQGLSASRQHTKHQKQTEIVAQNNVASSLDGVSNSRDVSNLMSIASVSPKYFYTQEMDESSKIARNLDKYMDGSKLIIKSVKYKDSFGDVDAVIELKPVSDLSSHDIAVIKAACRIVLQDTAIQCSMVYVNFTDINENVVYSVGAYLSDPGNANTLSLVDLTPSGTLDHSFGFDFKSLSTGMSSDINPKVLSPSSNSELASSCKTVVLSDCTYVIGTLVRAKSASDYEHQFDTFSRIFMAVQEKLKRPTVIALSDGTQFNSTLLTANRCKMYESAITSKSALAITILQVQEVLEKSQVSNGISGSIGALYDQLR